MEFNPPLQGLKRFLPPVSWNRLVEIKATVQGSPVTVAKYEFDGLNHRVKSHIDTAAPEAPDGTVDIYRHFYYNAGWQLLETRRSTSENADPETLGATVKIEWQFVWSARPDASTASWARYIDAPVLRDRNADLDSGTGSLGKASSGLEERLYYATDANMNVTALVNTDGTVAERYRYDPYGNCTVLKADWTLQQVSGHADGTASAYDNPILYCGYYRDAETGLYNVRNRVYHAQLGRWVQRDPAAYREVAASHMLLYCDSSPLVELDPAGLEGSPAAPPKSSCDSCSGSAVQGYNVIFRDFKRPVIVDIYRRDIPVPVASMTVIARSKEDIQFALFVNGSLVGRSWPECTESCVRTCTCYYVGAGQGTFDYDVFGFGLEKVSFWYRGHFRTVQINAQVHAWGKARFDKTYAFRKYVPEACASGDPAGSSGNINAVDGSASVTLLGEQAEGRILSVTALDDWGPPPTIK